MRYRDRYRAVLKFESVDKIPFEPGEPRESTLARWCSEGLHDPQQWFASLCTCIGIPGYAAGERHIELDVNFNLLPAFEEKTLERRNGHYLIQDAKGIVVEVSDDYDASYLRQAKDFVTRAYHRFPVQKPQDFKAIKKRYLASDVQRYPADFAQHVRRCRDSEAVISLVVPGPFWQLRDWVGFENLCIFFAEDADFVHEMVGFWQEFVSQTMRRALESGVVDRLFINEDMAYKEKSMISPAMTREFLAPTWTRWAREAQQAGVALIDEDSDGYIHELIPIWIESGFNVCDPFEVAAGNDIVQCRQIHGRSMAFRMGVDKRKIAAGGRDMQEELQRLQPVIASGGFIPGCDHGVPPDISWADFIDYGRHLAMLTGWI